MVPLVNLVLATGILVSGFQPGGGEAMVVSPPGNAYCTVRSDNPHGSKGTPGDMVGKTRYGCNQDIDSITVDVQIEQNDGGTWKVVASRPGQTRQGPKANVTYTAQVEMPCRPGVFRTASRGSGYYGGRPSGSMAWHYSQMVTDPCS